MHSKCMASAWQLHGTCMAYALQMHGECIANAWQVCGLDLFSFGFVLQQQHFAARLITQCHVREWKDYFSTSRHGRVLKLTRIMPIVCATVWFIVCRNMVVSLYCRQRAQQSHPEHKEQTHYPLLFSSCTGASTPSSIKLIKLLYCTVLYFHLL